MSQGAESSPPEHVFGKFRTTEDILAVLMPIAFGLFALWAATHTPVAAGTSPLLGLMPATPLAMTLSVIGVALIAGGVAVTWFNLKIKAPQDYFGGIVLIGVAVFAIWASGDLPGMRGFAFGPGTAPRLFASILAGLGLAIVLTSLLLDGPPLERYAVRGPFWITVSLFVFAALIRPVGLIVASFATFVIAGFASSETRWLENGIMAVIMTAFCVALFVYLLNLPFQLWPRF